MNGTPTEDLGRGGQSSRKARCVIRRRTEVSLQPLIRLAGRLGTYKSFPLLLVNSKPAYHRSDYTS